MSYLIKPIDVSGYSTYSRPGPGTYFDRFKVMRTAGADVQRVHWDPGTGEFRGVLVEPASTNLLLNSATLATQTRPVVPGTTYTLSFYGTGVVTLTGAAGASVAGLEAYPGKRAEFKFVAAGTTLTLTVSGAALYAQLEPLDRATSYILTTSAPASRAADVVGPPGMFQTSFPQPYADYSNTATYQQGDVVVVGLLLYESLVDGNVGMYPPDHSVKDSPDSKWIVRAPINYFACVDQKVGVASVGPGPIQTTALKLPSATATAVALVGTRATRVHVAVQTESGAVKSQSADLAGGNSVVFYGFPPGALVSVAVENTAGDVVIGELICGSWHDLGGLRRGHRFGIRDFSLKTEDQWGNLVFLERPYSKRVKYSLRVPKANYNAVVNLLTYVRARPTVFIATLDKAYAAGAICYGNASVFEIEIDYDTWSLLYLEIQGLSQD